MQTVSPLWSSALPFAHGLAVQIDVRYNGVTTATDIDFISGSVKVDRGSDVRRSLSLSIADPTAFPLNPTDTYGVYGQMLYVQGGLRYLNGSVEMVPLGQFVIQSVSGNIHTGPLDITASGMEILFKRTEFEAAQSTAGWTSTAAGMAALVGAVSPASGFVDRSTSGAAAIASKTWDAGSDYWAAMTEMASAIGAEIYADANGTFILADVPDVNSATAATVWDVTTGDSGVMISADVTLSGDDVYNRVIASGENTSDDKPPVSASATITDSSDPLRYGGPFGKVTKKYDSALITSTAMATSTATALLRKYRAPNRTVSLDTIPNPALDAGDRIRVVYGRGMDSELHLVQSFEIPLTESSASTIETISGRTDADG
ncbi:DUF5047 domain-containing protein [Streptomyces sp. NBC_01180]|uniref:DUF5047 domain-containing protein n=1 Tax=Streptomyces sp. NBC_01180 TaxID=2903763 RepID=UPI00386EF40E|nr:DUF5047 domain-containing protein [Streptomyces sp. NBC_01180]